MISSIKHNLILYHHGSVRGNTDSDAKIRDYYCRYTTILYIAFIIWKLKFK
jgi:hypothetical protein